LRRHFRLALFLAAVSGLSMVGCGSGAGDQGTGGTGGGQAAAGQGGSSKGSGGVSGSGGLGGAAAGSGGHAAGTAGTAGSAGSGGASGNAGSAGGGASGNAGSAGASGNSGTAGASGSAGNAGSGGASGNSGTAGAGGSAGTVGSAGASGNAGSAGSGGASGSATGGNSGAAGAPAGGSNGAAGAPAGGSTGSGGTPDLSACEEAGAVTGDYCFGITGTKPDLSGPLAAEGCAGLTDPAQNKACNDLLTCLRSAPCIAQITHDTAIDPGEYAYPDDPLACLCGDAAVTSRTTCLTATSWSGVCQDKFITATTGGAANVISTALDNRYAVGIAGKVAKCDIDAMCIPAAGF
jgi:hypothetical protein